MKGPAERLQSGDSVAKTAGSVSPRRHGEPTYTRWKDGGFQAAQDRLTILRGGQIGHICVACDGRRWACLLTELGWKMTFTDANEAPLGLCQERLPAAECVLMLSEETRLPLALVPFPTGE